ncbi:hypothetical protein WJX72_012007 [[Myrmecia] bisecta]|uniref:Ubiquitin-like protease family profile domain-containing protein n=1 Tax=[Myrmecia] bisecta TaxID=41462 RepID=A0AAW1QGN2_9CHLO
MLVIAGSEAELTAHGYPSRHRLRICVPRLLILPCVNLCYHWLFEIFDTKGHLRIRRKDLQLWREFRDPECFYIGFSSERLVAVFRYLAGAGRHMSFTDMSHPRIAYNLDTAEAKEWQMTCRFHDLLAPLGIGMTAPAVSHQAHDVELTGLERKVTVQVAAPTSALTLK